MSAILPEDLLNKRLGYTWVVLEVNFKTLLYNCFIGAIYYTSSDVSQRADRPKGKVYGEHPLF